MSGIDISVANWRGTIEVDDFGPLSAYDAGFADELAAAVIELSDHDEVKALVLRSRGTSFAPARPADAPAVTDIPTVWHRSFAASAALSQALCFSKKVVVTVVTGECSGAGSNLVLCSDLTIADESATFGSPFQNHPESNFVLAALTIRLNRAKAWAVRGRAFDAAKALEIGLVNEVVPEAEVDACVDEMVRSIAGMPLDGVTMSKMLQQAVYDGHGIGREFDMTDHYAVHRWAAATPSAGGVR